MKRDKTTTVEIKIANMMKVGLGKFYLQIR